MDKIEIGKRLRELREQEGLTQKQLAAMLGIKNPSTVGSWEIGKSEPNLSTFSDLCALYNVSDIHFVIPASIVTALEDEPQKDLSTLSSLMYEKIGHCPSKKDVELANQLLETLCGFLK